MKEFLAEDNACGQTILMLVSRGNAIIAELFRLKDYIPKLYRLESRQDVQKYGEIILDFSYLKTSEIQEGKVEANEQLRELDEELRANHIEIIKRFYLLFESIHAYITDLNHYVEELEDGVYIHQSLETVFQDAEGKQLLCEALFLYGLMLLAIDTHIDGIIRERLLVSFNRYTPLRRDTQSSFDEVCKLLMDTGCNSSKRPQNYPEDYFKRVSINPTYIEMVIGRLRSDDIYLQVPVYSLPKYRSTALATQASMLYVCLFFSVEILHSETAIMREIVDKFFPDNWVISVYMGFIVNLADTWEHFKAAKQALGNTLQPVNLKNLTVAYGLKIPELLATTGNFLKEGVITRDTLLKNITAIVNCLRECNVVLRWLILHIVLKPGTSDKNKRLKQLRDAVASDANCEHSQVFRVLLNTAQLELVTKELYRNLISEKDRQWDSLKDVCQQNLKELAEVFGGAKPLSRIKKNSDLERWFLEIAKQVENLSRDDSGSVRKLVQLIHALEEVQEYHQLGNHMQVVQFLSETRRDLDQMIQTMKINEDVLIHLQIIGDISYAWELIDFYTSLMQNGIKKEPKLVIKLRAVFLKLASALELPLLRINQAHSEDLVSVSEYYSNELDIYVRKVLQIIPSTMFEKLARIIQMQTNVINEVPSRVDKDKLRDYAQLDERFEFAELTHSVSIFSQGMRLMKSTLVGVVCLDPKQLLEDGIRKELVQHVSRALHNHFTFSVKPKPDELETKLRTLSLIMDGFKRSFEYIQDYININGLKIWQEEVTRIVNYNVEQECNGCTPFLRNKVQPWQSRFQSRYVPIPIYPALDQSENFVGRLAREIIRLTDPRCSVYLPSTCTWYDIKSHKPVLNKETIALIAQTVEITGLVGLDRLFSFMIITALQRITAHLTHKNVKVTSWSNVINAIHTDMKERSIEDDVNPLKVYQTYVSRTTKIWPEFLEKTVLVGQLQILRNLIAFHLNKSCKFNAKNLEASLRTLNRSLLLDLSQDKPMPSENIIKKLSEYLDYAGLNDPLNKVYVIEHSDKSYAITMFIFVLAHVKLMFLPQKLASLSKRSSEQIDGTALSVSVYTVLKQFHLEVTRHFVKLVANYVFRLSQNNGLKNTDVLAEITMMLNFMESFVNYSEDSRTFYRQNLPEEILLIQQSLVIGV